MSKERLEEIAYNVGVSLDGEKAIMSSDDYDFLYNYALQQAERVQELETFKEEMENRYKIWHIGAKKSLAEKEELKQQNKRYREALEEIANWDGWLIEPNPLCTVEEAYERCVDIAIEALEDEE